MAACKSNIFLIILVILKKIILCNKTIIITTYYKIWSNHQNYDLKTKFTRQGNTKITCEIADLNFIYCFICWTAKCLEEISQKFLAQQKKCKFSGFFDGMNMMIFHLDKEDRKLVSSAKFSIPIIPLPPADSFCEHFSSNPNITTVSAWVLIPPRKPQPSNFFCPPRHWKT